MSLNWSLPKGRDVSEFYDTLKDGSVQRKPATEAMIWGSLALGFQSITEKNYTDIYTRFALFQKVGYSVLQVNGENYTVTLEDVKNHIGFGTNVSNITFTAFKNRLFSQMVDDVKRDIRSAKNA